MIYVEYEKLKKSYNDTQKNFLDVLDKKEELFQRTQPKSPDYDKERVAGGEYTNRMESYVIELEKIRDQLDEAENILHKRLLLIREKEKELRMSRKTDDMVYVLRFLERMRIEDIADQMRYSVGAINKYLKKIRDNIKECTKL